MPGAWRRGRRVCVLAAREARAGRDGCGPAPSQRIAGSKERACASVAFWNASKIFFNATVSPVRLSTAFHTMP